MLMSSTMAPGVYATARGVKPPASSGVDHRDRDLPQIGLEVAREPGDDQVRPLGQRTAVEQLELRALDLLEIAQTFLRESSASALLQLLAAAASRSMALSEMTP
jgi:hypothetical protein